MKKNVLIVMFLLGFTNGLIGMGFFSAKKVEMIKKLNQIRLDYINKNHGSIVPTSPDMKFTNFDEKMGNVERLLNVANKLLAKYNVKHNGQVTEYWKSRKNIEDQLINWRSSLQAIEKDSIDVQKVLAVINSLKQQKKSLKHHEGRLLGKLNDQGSFYRSLISSIKQADRLKKRSDFDSSSFFQQDRSRE